MCIVIVVSVTGFIFFVKGLTVKEKKGTYDFLQRDRNRAVCVI